MVIGLSPASYDEVRDHGKVVGGVGRHDVGGDRVDVGGGGTDAGVHVVADDTELDVMRIGRGVPAAAAPIGDTTTADSSSASEPRVALFRTWQTSVAQAVAERVERCAGVACRRDGDRQLALGVHLAV